MGSKLGYIFIYGMQQRIPLRLHMHSHPMALYRSPPWMREARHEKLVANREPKERVHMDLTLNLILMARSLCKCRRQERHRNDTSV